MGKTFSNIALHCGEADLGSGKLCAPFPLCLRSLRRHGTKLKVCLRSLRRHSVKLKVSLRRPRRYTAGLKVCLRRLRKNTLKLRECLRRLQKIVFILETKPVWLPESPVVPAED